MTSHAPHLFDLINAALPQTQCTRCGYPDCAAYAQAIAAGQAAINQCPPGGTQGMERLSAITGLPAQPLNPVNGLESPRTVAFIDEAWCIGCTLCIKACPVDAIIGSHKLMHTVIEPACTGCELCLPVCPVDCISLENVTGLRTGWSAWSQAQAEAAKTRYQFRLARQPRPQSQDGQPPEALPQVQPAAALGGEPAAQTDAGSPLADRKRQMIQAALARSRAQRQPQNDPKSP